MSEKREQIDKNKVKPMQKQKKQRRLIIDKIETLGSSTVPELSEATGIQADEVLKHTITLVQSKQITIVGRKGDYLVYGLNGKK